MDWKNFIMNIIIEKWIKKQLNSIEITRVDMGYQKVTNLYSTSHGKFTDRFIPSTLFTDALQQSWPPNQPN